MAKLWSKALIGSTDRHRHVIGKSEGGGLLVRQLYNDANFKCRWLWRVQAVNSIARSADDILNVAAKLYVLRSQNRRSILKFDLASGLPPGRGPGLNGCTSSRASYPARRAFDRSLLHSLTNGRGLRIPGISLRSLATCRILFRTAITPLQVVDKRARGSRESAYRGRYEIRGNHINCWDDSGFTADGEFIDGVLHHGGMVLYRRD